MQQMADSARYCYEDFEAIDAKAAKKNLRPVILEPMKVVRQRFAELGVWTAAGIGETIEQVAAQFDLNMGKVGQPVRVAVTGGPVSPPIDVTVWLVGRERTMRRIGQAVELIERRATSSRN